VGQRHVGGEFIAEIRRGRARPMEKAVTLAVAPSSTVRRLSLLAPVIARSCLAAARSVAKIERTVLREMSNDT